MSLEVDLIGLQEVDSRSAGPPPSDQLAYLSKATGLHAVAGPTVWRSDGRYGNALLAKRRILSIRRHHLAYPGHQPPAVHRPPASPRAPLAAQGLCPALRADYRNFLTSRSV